jgi:PKD repeat protein
MNTPNQSGIYLVTEMERYSVAPGATLEIPITLKNEGVSPDQIRITVEGIPLPWVSTEQPILIIQPGEERQISLIVQPPAPPSGNAGRHRLQIVATSTLDPERRAEILVVLTVAGFEVEGRIGVLLNGLQYSATPGEKMVIPVVLINQGLGADTFHLVTEGLPEDWVSQKTSSWHLDAGEVANGVLVIQPPRNSASRAGRRQFSIFVKSEQAPEQTVSIDSILTVAAFTEIKADLIAPSPEDEQPARVRVTNLSNIPTTVQISWESPEGALAFEPNETQQVSLALDETTELEYKAIPVQRYWVGTEKSHPYTVTVQPGGQEAINLSGNLQQKAVMPPWAAIVGGSLLLMCCLLSFWALVLRGDFFGAQDLTPTITETSTATTLPLPTATQSQVDQRPLLVDRNWFLVAYNNSSSKPGTQEPFTRFNPDGTLIGFTGCKNLNGTYQTEYNRLLISTINLANGSCPDTALQVQEDMFVAILRSANSYFVADTTLQVTGGAGFLNYSLTPPVRPEEIAPPQAVIQSPTQALTGEVALFDGSQSTGQAPLVSWRWEFGDGRVASGMVVQHAFSASGTFVVQLTVTDQRGQTNVTNRQILILPPPTTVPTNTPQPTATPVPPTPTLPAAPTAEPPPALPTTTEAPPPTEVPQPELIPPQANLNAPRSGYLGEPIDLDASSSREGSSPIVSFSWSFGNGKSQPGSPAARITTIYNNTGIYEILVTVTDANGLSSSATAVITINARLDTQAWTLSTINNQPLVPGTAITLQFLDGEIAGFAGCNSYNGRYTATDNGDGTYGVTVDQIALGRLSCPPEIMIQENDFQSAILEISSATIRENMLILTGPDSQLIFYLIIPPPVAIINAPSEGVAAQSVNFNAGNSTADGIITEFSWDFGDGARGNGVSVDHSFANPGTYNVILTVTDSNRITVSATQTITIR